MIKDSDINKLMKSIYEEASIEIVRRYNLIISRNDYKARLDYIQDIIASLKQEHEKWAGVVLPMYYIEGKTFVEELLGLGEEIQVVNNYEKAKERNNNIIKDMSQVEVGEMVNLINSSIYYNDKMVKSLEGNLDRLGKNEDGIKYLVTTGPVAILSPYSGKFRRITLDTYGKQYIVNTDIVKSLNVGSVQTSRRLGIQYMQRYERADCCPICRPHRGEIWDITVPGDDRPELYHNNCRGSWRPYIK